MIALSLSTGIIFVLLAYTLMSLYDMWQVYRTTSKLWMFVLFLATLISLIVAFFVAPVLALFFYWSRHPLKRNIGIVLLIVVCLISIMTKLSS